MCDSCVHSRTATEWRTRSLSLVYAPSHCKIPGVESEPIRRAHPRLGGPGPFPTPMRIKDPGCGLRPLAGRPPAPSGPAALARWQEPPAPLTPSQWQAAAGGKPRRLGVGVAPARTYGHGKPGTVQASAPLATCGIRADGPFGHTGSQLEPTNRNVVGCSRMTNAGRTQLPASHYGA